jgi:hypothetical protein
MFRRIKTHMNPASLLAMVALFVALGGVSYAAATINGKDIKNGTVAGKKLKGKTVTGAKVKGNTLTGAQVNESSLAKVPSATSADQAASAASATTAANATGIADNTVSSAKVADGSLTGHDVGRRAGSNAFTIGSIPAGTCEVKASQVAEGVDMRDDAITVTAEQNLAAGLVISSENSDSPGFIRINVCNVTGAAVDGGSHVFHWVAFDV